MLVVVSGLFSWSEGLASFMVLVGTVAVVVNRVMLRRQGLAPRQGQAIAARGSGAGLAKSEALIVGVVFRELHDQRDDDGTRHAYAYLWNLSVPPQPGMRVWVPGYDGPSTAVVRGLGTRADLEGHEAKSVLRLVTQAELDEAQRAPREWLRMMLAQAGHPVGRVASQAPAGFPDIPPARLVPGVDADEVGRVWWRAYKMATDPDEAARLKSIADAWFRQRDELEDAKNADAIRRRHRDTLVRGRHYTEWVSTVADLKREGRYEEALQLLSECQQATTREDPGRPAPHYFEHAAIIYRKLKNREAEVEVLERYIELSREPSKRLVERLEKLRA